MVVCSMAVDVISLIVLILTTFLVICKINKTFRQMFFSRLYTRVIQRYYLDIDATKRELFGGLGNIVSRDKDLQKKGQIRILEIGVGPGANFKYYPKNTNLIAVDTNPYFRKYFDENTNKFPEILLEKFVLGEGENMAVIKDGSVDVVVTTVVLCSVRDIAQILREIKRVLAPGGKYFFLEHVAAERGTYRHLLQTIVNPIWTIFTDGCEVTRRPGQLIHDAGFSKINMKHFDSTFQSIFNLVLCPHLKGIAEK